MNNAEIISKYKTREHKIHVILLCLGMLMILLTIICIMAGSSNISAIEVIKALLRKGNKTNILIVYNIRLPRVLAAIIAGASLALAGTIMQAVLQNPMASPSTMGISNAAVFGANFAIIVLGAGAFHSTDGTSVTISNPYLVSTFAFACAICSTLVILALSATKKFAKETILLAGVAVGSIFQALTTIIQYFSIDTQVAAAVYWTFGNLSRATYTYDAIMFVILIVCFIYFYFNRHNYDAMENGDEVAKSLGVKHKQITVISLLLASLLTSISVSFLGIIGFIGLIAPQIMKRVIGNSHRHLLVGSMLCGSSVLLLADTIGRTIIKGIALPVGAITSILGGPMFIYILLKGHNRR